MTFRSTCTDYYHFLSCGLRFVERNLGHTATPFILCGLRFVQRNLGHTATQFILCGLRFVQRNLAYDWEVSSRMAYTSRGSFDVWRLIISLRCVWRRPFIRRCSERACTVLWIELVRRNEKKQMMHKINISSNANSIDYWTNRRTNPWQNN